jgi:hypothetical protein
MTDTQKLIRDLEGLMAAPANTEEERERNHALAETMDFIKRSRGDATTREDEGATNAAQSSPPSSTDTLNKKAFDAACLAFQKECVDAHAVSDGDISAAIKAYLEHLPSEIRYPQIPTEAMCDAARAFILKLDMGIRNFCDMRRALERSGNPILPYIAERAKDGQGAHITKWDIADIIWQYMAAALPKHEAQSASLALTFTNDNWRDADGNVWIKPEPGKWMGTFDKPEVEEAQPSEEITALGESVIERLAIGLCQYHIDKMPPHVSKDFGWPRCTSPETKQQYMQQATLTAEILKYTTPKREYIVPEGFQLVPKKALEWLFGEGDSDFMPPADAKGKYWWRSIFRKKINEIEDGGANA